MVCKAIGEATFDAGRGICNALFVTMVDADWRGLIENGRLTTVQIVALDVSGRLATLDARSNRARIAQR